MKTSFWTDFKKFAMRGNVIDMAVGVIIGGAFGKIVSSVVADLIMPILGLSWRFCSVNVMMMSLGLFSLIGRIKLNGSRRGTQLLADISIKSYGMYLAHIMLLNLYYGLFSPLFEAAYITIPIISVCTFITVYLLVKVLSWLPKSKYLIG